MTGRSIDGLFLSYFEDVDRWHNDHVVGGPRMGSTSVRREVAEDPENDSEFSRLVSQSVGLGDGLVDMPRFFSWVAHGTTAFYQRYHPFSLTHLSGSYARSLAAAHGREVVHVNFANRLTLPELGQAYEPRWVLLSTTFLSETTRMLDACQRVRRQWPDAGLAVGGLVLLELEKSMPPQAFRRLLGACGADAYVLSPQGEEALLALLGRERGELGGVELPHTMVRANGGYALSTEREGRHHPLDESYVRWSRLDPASLYHTVHTRTARSCAFRCAFCTFPQLQGSLELMEPESLERELVELERAGTVRSLIFTDDTFNVPPERFKDLCRVLARHDFAWYSFFRPQFSDAETARLMRESNCRAVFLGIESADDGMLARMGKPASIEKVKRGIRHLQDEGIGLHANFIVGFPGDVPANAWKIVDLLDELELDFFYASAWFNSPTAPVSKEKDKYGIEGLYYRWKHATMDSAQAISLEKELQAAPRHSLFVSETTQFTFWGEVMLYCNGYERDEVRQAIATFNRFTGRHTPREELASHPEVVRLRALLHRKPFPVPPGCIESPAPAAVAHAGNGGAP